MKSRTIAIVLASGTGVRFLSETPKQFLKLAGKTVLEHTLDVFEQHVAVDETIIVVSGENRLLTQEIVTRAAYKKISKIIIGGTTRQASVALGISAIQGDSHKVLVHDAVRPLLNAMIISRCINALDDYDVVDTAIPSPDTIIQVDERNCIVDIPPRASLRLGQTPQAFRAGILRKAHNLANNDNSLAVTDDCGLILHYKLGPIAVVDGDVSNIKITYPSDIYLADRLFQLRSSQINNRQDLTDLSGKIVIVFGAGRGIGKRIAQLVDIHGGHVVAVSRSTGVDVTDVDAVRNTLFNAKQQYGRVDIVINTAGILRTGLLAGQSYDLISEQILTNVQGSVVVAREAFEVMRATGGGSIVLFTSSSYTRGRAMSAVYSATKAAVVNLTQGLAQEYEGLNVRINAINPERTATPMRTENFGNESNDILLDVDTVALATLVASLSPVTGEVIDVRR